MDRVMDSGDVSASESETIIHLRAFPFGTPNAESSLPSSVFAVSLFRHTHLRQEEFDLKYIRYISQRPCYVLLYDDRSAKQNMVRSRTSAAVLHNTNHTQITPGCKGGRREERPSFGNYNLVPQSVVWMCALVVNLVFAASKRRSPGT